MPHLESNRNCDIGHRRPWPALALSARSVEGLQVSKPSQLSSKDSRLGTIAEVEQRLATLAELEHLLKRKSDAVHSSNASLSDVIPSARKL